MYHIIDAPSIISPTPRPFAIGFSSFIMWIPAPISSGPDMSRTAKKRIFIMEAIMRIIASPPSMAIAIPASLVVSSVE